MLVETPDLRYLARQDLKRALKLTEALPADWTKINPLSNAAKTMQVFGEDPAPQVEQLLKLSTLMDDNPHYAGIIFRDIAEIFSRQGRFNESFQMMRKVPPKSVWGTFHTYLQIMEDQAAQGENYNKALKKASRAVYEEYGKRHQASGTTLIAKSLYRIDQDPQPTLSRAFRQARQDRQNKGYAFERVAEAYAYCGFLDQAKRTIILIDDVEHQNVAWEFIARNEIKKGRFTDVFQTVPRISEGRITAELWAEGAVASADKKPDLARKMLDLSAISERQFLKKIKGEQFEGSYTSKLAKAYALRAWAKMKFGEKANNVFSGAKEKAALGDSEDQAEVFLHIAGIEFQAGFDPSSTLKLAQSAAEEIIKQASPEGDWVDVAYGMIALEDTAMRMIELDCFDLVPPVVDHFEDTDSTKVEILLELAKGRYLCPQ
ncbi:MAG: hypothetical protein ABIH88_00820 [Patescibacteria group bacterium]|nr:hypothetical protein [Patescibacteria group bacterium]